MDKFLDKIFFRSRNLDYISQNLKDITNQTPANKIFEAINNYSESSEVRYVGGCIRKVINKEVVDDIDLATNLKPNEICEALKNKEQIILFQNRRGYSPIIECTTCGISPQCPNCDVSLTFHQYKNQLRCHYCGYHTPKMISCIACGSETLDSKGFGTEQIEMELKALFPEKNRPLENMFPDGFRSSYLVRDLGNHRFGGVGPSPVH